MRIFQSRLFEKKVKKMSKSEKDALDREVKRIAEDSSLGEEKKGDLKDVFVHKFKLKTTQYLLAYRKVGGDLELIIIGPHENYYRDLKQCLRNRNIGDGSI
jgi:mRNA-degrading endonuclease RelE of RelBE toxin-antitoxin system